MKRRAAEPKPYMTTGTVKRSGKLIKSTFAPIYKDVLLSYAYLSLSSRQRQLYICCRVHEFGERHPARDFGEDFPEWEKVKGEWCFYLPFHEAVRYIPEYGKSSGRFYKDLKALEDHGFIEKVVSGKSTRTMNVYRFSCGWKAYNISGQPP